MVKILTVTSNDLGISWGPAIHYLELWNEVVINSDFKIEGLSPSWTGKVPIVESKFSLKRINVPNLGGFRQVVYDLKVFLFYLRNSKDYELFYIRLSHWHIFQILFLILFSKKFILELNGLSREDSLSSQKNWLSYWIITRQEKWLVKNAILNICVSDGIESTVKSRYGNHIKTITISNGVATEFFMEEKRKHSDQLSIAYVGTFTPWDGAKKVVELASYFPHVKFLMVGEGIARQTIQLNAPDNVEFIGALAYRKLPGLYQTVNGGIVLYEAQRHKNVKLSSLKTLEYVASRLPIFSTEVNGQEFIREKGFGYLHNENNDIVEDFAKFLNSLGEYQNSYKLAEANLSIDYGWKGTALKTIQSIEAIELK